MMWKRITTLILAFMTAFMLTQSVQADEVKYKEGVNYKVFDNPLTKTKEIREFFSFWCGHCFSLQGFFHQLADTYKNANFVRNPVMMLGGAMGPESQKALVIAANMGVEDQFVDNLFKSMHVEGKIPMSVDDMATFMTTIGVPANKYMQERNSFMVIGRVSEFDKWGDSIELSAVPEILVNGKYLVTMESVNSDKEFIDLVGYLLNLDNLPDAK